MWCGVVTLFPQMFSALTEHGITRKAVEQQALQLSYWNPRDYTTDKHRTVDDRPYGGGPGMVMKVEPLQAAIQAARQAAGSQRRDMRVIALSPQGRRVTQQDIASLTQQSQVLFVCGRYEGIDERLYELEIDEEWSIGDYVISGGELAAMVVLDATARLLPGVLGHAQSAEQDSFSAGLLDCPHYTRPEVVEGLPVPDVLLNGHHADIAHWRKYQQVKRTWLRRSDLLVDEALDDAEQQMLETVIQEGK